jgi:hypothetical protein
MLQGFLPAFPPIAIFLLLPPQVLASVEGGHLSLIYKFRSEFRLLILMHLSRVEKTIATKMLLNNRFIEVVVSKPVTF